MKSMGRTRGCTGGCTGGFTVVELLVVIGIVALLLAILMPTLATARQSGREVVCQSNLSQLGIALTTYSIEHRQQLPPALMPTSAGIRSWDLDKVTVGGVTYTRPGFLWDFQGDAEVQQCPAFAPDPGSADAFIGYNYNTTYLGRDAAGGVRMGQVKRPAETLAFGDGQWAGGPNKFMRAPRYRGVDGALAPDVAFTTVRMGGMQGFRHLGRTNALWVDGHASSESGRFGTYDAGPVSNPRQSVAGDPLGFLSEDNSLYDLQ